MTITGTSAASPLPQSFDLSALVPVLQQLTQTLTSLIGVLQAQLVPAGGALAGGQADAGAATVGGGGMDGCCGGAMGAVAGADALGATAAPPAIAEPAQQSKKSGGAKAGPAQQTRAATAADDPPASSSKGQQIVDFAKKQLGKNYVYGAAGPNTFDCSGLTLKALAEVGVKLPHRAEMQSKMGEKVEKGDLQPGDLVFFNTADDGGVGHVGIFIGDGKFIHAPKTGDVVKISNLSDSYYTQKYAGARRLA